MAIVLSGTWETSEERKRNEELEESIVAGKRGNAVTAQKKWLGLWMYDRVLTIRVDSAGIPYGSHGNRIGDVGEVRESRCTCHAMPSKRQLKMWRPWRENDYWQLNYRVA